MCMRGIDREVTRDRRHIAKLPPDTAQSDRLLRQGQSFHISNDKATLLRVAQAIMDGVPQTGIVRGYDRLSIKFIPR